MSTDGFINDLRVFQLSDVTRLDDFSLSAKDLKYSFLDLRRVEVTLFSIGDYVKPCPIDK